MRRRELMVLLGGALIGSPAARAQQKAMSVIGYLNPTSANANARNVVAFRQGLSEVGYIEGQNLAIEYSRAAAQAARAAFRIGPSSQGNRPSHKPERSER